MRKTALYLGGLFLATGAALAVSAPAQAAPSTPTCGGYNYTYNCYKPYGYQKPNNYIVSQNADVRQVGKYNISEVNQNQNAFGTQIQAGDDIWGW
ncbi:hypothetical protein KZ829_17425 [Actinoplanes hulinensis]|uniref:Uncharacterized protein n=1 Tax=Actinoplanes hulinensis TaxID=1144547 RepID=A0ABS7B3B2_9ACTN|nr:hypothetical protein [Actinoplanes hulinensis]MBW6435523.1 hypothetical protein [Actinoplanes hulinensis]